MGATVPRKRTTIWLDADDDGAMDVHSEDDMVMIEATGADGNETEVLICPNLFDRIIAVIEGLQRVYCGECKRMVHRDFGPDGSVVTCSVCGTGLSRS